MISCNTAENLYAVDPVDGHTLLLAEPALHLCRLRVPGVGIVNKGDAAVTVTHVYDDISLTSPCR